MTSTLDEVVESCLAMVRFNEGLKGVFVAAGFVDRIRVPLGKMRRMVFVVGVLLGVVCSEICERRRE